MQALTVKVSTIGEDGAAALMELAHRLRSEDLPPKERDCATVAT